VRHRGRRRGSVRRGIAARGARGCDAALNLATALPSPRRAGDFAKNDELRRTGTPIFARACRDAGVARVVQQSIAMVHAGGGDALADETTPQQLDYAVAADALAAARAMEAAIEASGLDWLILRGGLFYGPAPTTTKTGSRARARASCGCPAPATTGSRCCTSRTWPAPPWPRCSAGRRGAR
jgi:nucleoside-diphosphate-sugar epimerase